MIVDLPTDDPAYMEKLMEERGWGPVVLFVDEKVSNNVLHAFMYTASSYRLNLSSQIFQNNLT